MEKRMTSGSWLRKLVLVPGWVGRSRWRLLTAAFVGLSLLDLVLTWRLVGGTGGAVYEANPVAAAVLSRFGWLGLSLFKAGCVGVALGAIGLVGWLRPGLGSRLLSFACPALLGLVSYSVVLVAVNNMDSASTASLLREEAERAAHLQEEFEKSKSFAAEMDR